MRVILNNLAEDIDPDSSAFKNYRVSEAERDLIKYFLGLLDNGQIAVHAGLTSRLHELKALYPAL